MWCLGLSFAVLPLSAQSHGIGALPEESGYQPDEQHLTVRFTHDLAVMTTELTQEVYETVVGENPSFHQGQPFQLKVSVGMILPLCQCLSRA